MSAEAELGELRSLLSKARRVKSGDVILPDDVNTLVDIAEKTIDLIDKLGKLFFISQIFLSIEGHCTTNPFTIPEASLIYHYGLLETALYAPAYPLIDISIYNG